MLNNEQHEAVYVDTPKLLCLAGAGCGKTHSMIQRIIRLVESGVDATSILVLTFTNAAALEMQTRYQTARPDDVRVPNFRTFHSFCYSLIATDPVLRVQLGYATVPEIATEAEQKEITQLAAAQSGIKSSNNLSQFLQDTLRKAVKRILRTRNLITFDIMCYDVCQLFVDDDVCIQKYKIKYKYLFVDEFQDTDPKQWTFVSSFKDSNIFVVADAIQAIYSFRGADSSIVKNLADDPEWYKVKLTYNYRSTSQICQFANNHSDHGEEAYRVQIHSNKEGPNVVTKMCGEDDTLRSILVECNRHHVANGGTCAVLCRTNAEVNAVIETCKNLQIPIVTKDAESNTTAALLRSVRDDNYAVTWLASKLRANAYNRYLRASFLENLSLKDFADMFLTSSDSDYLRNRYDTIIEWRQWLADIATPGDMMRFIHMVGDRILPEGTEIHKRSELIDALIDLYKDTSPENRSIETMYVGTIHSVKGLEYDSVMLLGVGGKSFRLTNEENKNLYYVGITRAKTYLYIWKGDAVNGCTSF